LQLRNYISISSRCYFKLFLNGSVLKLYCVMDKVASSSGGVSRREHIMSKSTPVLILLIGAVFTTVNFFFCR
ncbi:hypothetical protein L9F63_002865, partial [Diploptera punctata]